MYQLVVTIIVKHVFTDNYSNIYRYFHICFQLHRAKGVVYNRLQKPMTIELTS